MSAEGYAGKSVLVTGGLGFIGSSLAIRLVELGAHVTVVDSLIDDLGGNRFNVAPVEDRIQMRVADVRDQVVMKELVQGQDVVFHLAGQVSHVDSMESPIADLELNCESQLALLEACRRENGDARLVYAASRQQYGRPRYLPVDEEHPLDPVDVNGIHKTAAESALLLYHRLYGMRACSLRLTNTYGPRMLLRHNRQGFAAWFVRLALDGEQIELFGDGSALRDFNYVDDVVAAFLLCGFDERADGEVFNLGHPRPVSLREFVEVLFEVVGGGSVRAVSFPEERARIEIGSVYMDFDKIRRRLGWEPKVELREGLTRMVDYYRANREHYL